MKMVKFVKKMKENSDKKYVLVSQGFEPVTSLSHLKTLPTEPRAQCDMETVPFDKILNLKKVLKFKNGAKAIVIFFIKPVCKTHPILLISQWI